MSIFSFGSRARSSTIPSLKRRRRASHRNGLARGTRSRALSLEPLEERMLLSLMVSTDKTEYPPEEPILLSIGRLTPGETVELQVLHTDGMPNTGLGHEPWQVVDGGEYDADLAADGQIHTVTALTIDDSASSTFELTVHGFISGAEGTTSFTCAPAEPPPATMVALETDKVDYEPGELVRITATGFDVGETVEFAVLHIDGVPNTGVGHEPWQVTDGSEEDMDGRADGSILTTWDVNEHDSLGSEFQVTADGLTSEKAAWTTFTDHSDPLQALPTVLLAWIPTAPPGLNVLDC